jgi:hypothetical protein
MIAAMLTVLGAAAAFNVGALKWLLDRQRADLLRAEAARASELVRDFYELRAQLPIEYVRREDWIRFSGTLDAKLDAMREEMRDEIGALRHGQAGL